MLTASLKLESVGVPILPRRSLKKFWGFFASEIFPPQPILRLYVEYGEPGCRSECLLCACVAGRQTSSRETRDYNLFLIALQGRPSPDSHGATPFFFFPFLLPPPF